MSQLVSGEKTESMIGDLVEQRRRGRSSTWFWWQAISAIVTSFLAKAWEHNLQALAVVALSASLSDAYMLSGLPVWVNRLDRLWYPHLVHSKWSWMAINPWAYRLQLYSLTFRIVWCSLLAGVSWTMSRMRPRERGLMLTLFLVPQVGLCLPYLQTAVTDWLREPANPLWFFNALWFAIFACVAIPASILWGGSDRSSRVSESTTARP
jgi:hypothetical protein